MSKNIRIMGWDENYGMYENWFENNSDTPARVKLEMGPVDHERAMRFSMFSFNMKNLLGQVLTVIDSSIENERQCKAMKDVVKDAFHAKMNWVFELCGLPEEEMNYLPDAEK